jgi:pyridoxal/pyridoxine/pyridoxamine kinase
MKNKNKQTNKNQRKCGLVFCGYFNNEHQGEQVLQFLFPLSAKNLLIVIRG